MKADTLLLENYLLQKSGLADRNQIEKRKLNDPVFAEDLIAQTKVFLIALVYGRRKRRQLIEDVSAKVFAEIKFKNTIDSIFK